MATNSTTPYSARLRAWLTARRWRMAKRLGLVCGAFISVFSFISVDLARKDAVFSADFTQFHSAYPGAIVFTLNNQSAQIMDDAEIYFSLYDRDGARIAIRLEKGGWSDAQDDYFTPLGMTIGPYTAKDGAILTERVALPADEIDRVYVCATMRGSFWIDQVRTEYVLERNLAGGPGNYAQSEHKKSVHYLGAPNCVAPESLARG
ncbi:hypothetical protein [Tabrizicola aquatica]|uniref:hypothetical protein n=1 Tax=Tabrizicola aquatica TaxID=909926 RepID=UPI000CD216CC|nr:hypothetical protein [Tabrizicola aquatica]